MKQKIIFIIFVLIGVAYSDRVIHLHLQSGRVDYPFGEVDSLTFPEGEVLVYKSGGGTDSYNQSDVDSISYSKYETGTMTDQDGNVYKTVKVGNQWWMAENLKVTHYRNGETILKRTDPSVWKMLDKGAYCVYSNMEIFKGIYGCLYNWYAVTDSRNIAPIGWHVPTKAEWDELMNYLGGKNVAGGKLKETGTAHWHTCSSGTTNEVGFTALPGGKRYGSNGDFTSESSTAAFWTSSTSTADPSRVYFVEIYAIDRQSYDGSYTKRTGNSVRLVKD